MVEDRLLRQLLVTWLAPVDQAAAGTSGGEAAPAPADGGAASLPDLQALAPVGGLLPPLRLLPGIYGELCS